MTLAAAIFVLGVGALLVSWVLTRTSDRLARGTHQPDGRSFDVKALRPRLHIVRADFATQSSFRKQDSPYHEQLLECTRRAISRMAFFRRDDVPPN